MTEAHRGCSYVLNTFPTGIVLLNASGLLLALFTPDGPLRTRLEFRLYASPQAFGTPAQDAWRAARAERLQTVVRQDDRFVQHVQRVAASRDAAGIDTRFSPYWEGGVLHFQRLLLQAISAQ
ncbi:SRPBCC family protein [Roseateles toxinivorans]|uniref:Ring hydroxylating enzyme alpha subunit n=1 Tax=Roseateles toxinivorans TaxID=270368 RepID=A0A4R6QES1_9BURK|nr:ring hydroxylating enzyme alpha subunit [Roseateles toxinivorans]